MRFISLLLFCLTTSFGIAQNSKFLSKVNLTADNLYRTKEHIFLYPRGFLYALDQPSELVYLNCISSDFKSIKKFIKTKKSDFLFKINTSVIRSLSETISDTVIFSSMNDILSKCYRRDAKQEDFNNFDFVIFYYWTDKMLDEVIFEEINKIVDFCKKSEKKILFLPVYVEV